MKIHFLESEFAIADAVAVGELAQIKEEGFRTVICNRRPGEDGFEEANVYAQAAEKLGLEWASIPVAAGEYSDADIEAFRQVLEKASPPILAFCRTGRRAIHLWAQSRAKDPQCNIPLLMKAAKESGHDPEPIRELLKK